eukprot:scaffold1440_cov332-Pavlova_lutheri.AAC.44
MACTTIHVDANFTSCVHSFIQMHRKDKGEHLKAQNCGYKGDRCLFQPGDARPSTELNSRAPSQ